MMHDAENDEYCLALVAMLDSQFGWRLSVTEEREYAAFLAARRCAKPNLSNDQCIAILKYYHAEHNDINALLKAAHPDYDAAWERMYGEVAHIVVAKASTSFKYIQGTTSLDDLTQQAIQDVMNGLGGFHHESSLQTWVFVVVLRCITRYHRAQKTRKRATLDAAQSLDAMPEGYDIPGDSSVSLPEETTLERSLLDLITQVLQAQRDPRLYQVFMLSKIEQEPLRAIGQRLSLSPARVLALLRQAIAVLQNDEVIRAWFEAGDSPHLSI